MGRYFMEDDKQIMEVKKCVECGHMYNQNGGVFSSDIPKIEKHYTIKYIHGYCGCLWP